VDNDLDYHRVSEDPHPIYMGELPRRWSDIPAKVVINMCGVFPLGEPYERRVFALAMLDVQEPEFLPKRAPFERFLDAVHAHAAEEESYWHCHAGINRSGMAVAAYLHRHRGLRISDAIAQLRNRRSAMVLCNTLFEKTLRTWYGGPDEQEFKEFNIEDYLRERVGRN
jgi:hypothetical protein